MVCALLFAAVTILYLDRQALSILAPQLTLDRGWSETDYAKMVAAYQFAYAIGVLGVGWLIDRLGTRWGFALFMALWSLAMAAHGWAGSVAALIAVRFALGLTQAGCFPCAIKSTAEWFPKKERALATGIFNSGSMLGPILAPIVILTLYHRAGWMVTCIALGFIGLVWAGVWFACYRLPDRSEPSPGQSAAAMSDDADDSGAPVPMALLFRRRATWAFLVGKLLSDPVWWFFLYWLPKFLHDQHDLRLTELGAPLVTIYSMTIVGSIGAGGLTQRLTRRGMDVRQARKRVMLIFALLPVPVLMAATTSNVWLAVLLIGLATAGHSGWMANLFSVVSDVFPKGAVASVTGIGTMAGALGGIFVARLAGFILDATGSYRLLFVLAAGSYLVAWSGVFLLLPRTEKAR